MRPSSRPPPEPTTDDALPPSKTRRKNEMHALQSLGERLAELTPDQLRSLALPDDLVTAVTDFRRFTKWEAKRRQMQYIGRLMRDVDPAPIAARLDALQRTSRAAVAGFHETEEWRNRMLREDDALAKFCALHPDADRAALARLIGEAKADYAAGRPPAAARKLFRALSGQLDAERTAVDAANEPREADA